MKEIARAVPIAPGNAGVLTTLARMQALVQSSAGSRWVRWALRQAVTTIPAPTEVLIGEIYEWVLAHMTYITDGEGSDSILALEEEIRSPDYLINRIYQKGLAEGDCDDFVILLAALLHGAKVPARWIVTSARDDAEYDHVWAQAWTGSKWIDLDGIHGAPMGWTVPMENVTNLHVYPL